jgi:tRNA-splicing ligase RtcB (3'-phosphate/5'-hydroxy nucleic acid ligase)
MFELKGKYGITKVFNDAVEESAMSQITQLINSPVAEYSKVRIMPDVHAGAGCVIGYTATLTDRMVPQIVGVDIGCGVLAAKLEDNVEIDYQTLDDVIRKHVPSGHNVCDTRTHLMDEVIEGICDRMEQDFNRVMCSIGSLGGGNHFIEVAEDENKNKWLLIHSGSRNFGLKIANWHQKKANKVCRDYTAGLAYLTGDDALDYYTDMDVAQTYARGNRLSMLTTILKHMNLGYVKNIESVHNYIDFKDNVVRKGAISAHKDELVIIPFNMRDGSIIGVGKGNDDWNNSAPHGAGRVMSRRKAKENIDLEDFKETMKGVWSSCISKATLDEAPMAYKKADHIVKYLEPTVEIKHRLIPVYNFKAS